MFKIEELAQYASKHRKEFVIRSFFEKEVE